MDYLLYFSLPQTAAFFFFTSFAPAFSALFAAWTVKDSWNVDEISEAYHHVKYEPSS